MQLALYQPDIAQNTGTLLRLGACLGVPVHVIGPAGFDLSDKALRRAGMDYLESATLVRHDGWTAFLAFVAARERRIVLATTKASLPYTDHAFGPADVLLLGRESAGVPDAVQDRADARVTIPMRPGLRSINVALAGAMILGEAFRQTQAFPPTVLPSPDG
ncbi:tRNA (cytidine(34)-2'-O)-methyltransferase [Mongoliimonas terrestris]|uniref:tRNA (cytidine(34)-2'-O)-methyltransferase n=1 Tax=Mongoliimonas terrestris TaxID=1709001 RepID=UPI0009498344|nr:tRNA (cytidine(34)-2'-O)-methyltransferase [Mongoliimonas terrestris]